MGRKNLTLCGLTAVLGAVLLPPQPVWTALEFASTIGVAAFFYQKPGPIGKTHESQTACKIHARREQLEPNEDHLADIPLDSAGH